MPWGANHTQPAKVGFIGVCCAPFPRQGGPPEGKCHLGSDLIQRGALLRFLAPYCCIDRPVEPPFNSLKLHLRRHGTRRMGGREPGGARRHQARTQALRHRRAGDGLLLRLRVFQPPGLPGVPRRDGRLGRCVSQQCAVCRLWFCRLLCIILMRTRSAHDA